MRFAFQTKNSCIVQAFLFFDCRTAAWLAECFATCGGPGLPLLTSPTHPRTAKSSACTEPKARRKSSFRQWSFEKKSVLRSKFKNHASLNQLRNMNMQTTDQVSACATSLVHFVLRFLLQRLNGLEYLQWRTSLFSSHIPRTYLEESGMNDQNVKCMLGMSTIDVTRWNPKLSSFWAKLSGEQVICPILCQNEENNKKF